MKLCYVLPKYDLDDTEHFAHIPHLLEAVAELMPVELLIERAQSEPTIKGVSNVMIAGRPRSSRILRSIRFARYAFKVARDGDVAFFLRYSRLATSILVLLRALTPLTICYWMSAGALPQFGHQTRRQSAITWLQESHSRWLLRRVDKVFTGPETMVAYMSEHWDVPDQKIRLLYNDIDTYTFRPPQGDEKNKIRRTLGWRSSESIVLFVHHLSPRKGSSLLVPIARSLDNELSRNFRIVVVGDGPSMKELMAEIDLYSLAGKIELKGGLPNRTLPELYRGADCLLMPSYEEGFPRVVIEAMASGLPVVATDAGGTRDVLGAGYPYCTEVGDVEGLVKGIQALLERPRVGSALATPLRERAINKYSTERVSRMLVSEIER